MNNYDSWYWFGAHSPAIFDGSGGKNYYYIADIDMILANINHKAFYENIDNKNRYKIIMDRDLTYLRSKKQDIDAVSKLANQNSLKHTMFIPTEYELEKIKVKDAMYSTNYWQGGVGYGSDYLSGKPQGFSGSYINTNGESVPISDFNSKSSFRPALYLNMDNVVFATSLGSSTGLAEVSQPELSADYTSIYQETKNISEMKVRVYNPSMTAVISDLTNTSGSKLTTSSGINETVVNSTINVEATANSVSNSTVSALVFDSNGNFVFYRPLEAAKGNGLYRFDTTGIPEDKYQISIVNEVYNDFSAFAADCSGQSYVGEFRIVGPLSYNVQNSASTYTYKDNVNPSSVIAKVTSYSDGAGSPTFSILSDSASGHSEDYKNFEITANPTSYPVEIKVKADAPNLVNGSLKAGEYSFYVHGVDGNGDMGTADQKVIINVTQAQGTVNITSSTAQENLMLGNIASGTFTINNKETITPTCEINGDTSSALTVTECTLTDVIGTFKVQTDANHSGDDLPEDITLNISIPETENYKASTPAQKTFRVYKELNTFALEKKGSYTTLEVDKGASLGKLSVKDGISGYTYALTDAAVDSDKYDANQAVDNNKFEIGLVSGETVVKVVEKLGEGQYLFQLKVTDQTNKTLYLPVQINVGLATQSELKFKDNAGGTIKNDATFTYSATSPIVYAEGGNGTGAITYSVALKTPTNGDNPQDILKVDKDRGALTLLNVGTAYVTATKSGGSDYGDVSVTIPITVTAGPQSIAFDENTPNKHLVSQKTFDVHAQVSGRESGASAPGTIVYTSSSESICSVNSSGKVTIQRAGTCNINASNTDKNYKPVDDTATIEIYGDLDAEFEQTVLPVNVGTTSETAIGRIHKQTGGDGSYTYAMTSNILHVSDTGIVSLENTLTIEDIKEKYSVEKQQYVISETITMTDGNGYSTPIEVNMICQGVELRATFNNAVDDTITETYGVGKQINLSLFNNLSGGTVTYRKTDTLNVLTSLTPDTSGGAVAIINKAGDTPAIVEAVIEPKNGYRGQTLTVNIKVNKATQRLSFEPVLGNSMKFENDKTFTVNAKGQVEGTSITYEATPSNVCSNVNGTITMVGTGDCIITAKGNIENYEEATASSTITFYNGVLPQFNQTATNLQAKAEDAEIPSGEVPVGTITTSGGSNPSSIRYVISSNEGDANKAKDLFVVNGTGTLANMSLEKDIKVGELSSLGVYDSVNDTYLLKVQVDVFDDSDDVADATVDCVVKIKGASFKPTFTYEATSTNTITKTYGENYFDLSLENNIGGGDVSYAIQSETDMPTDIIHLSGTRVFIDNADEKTPTITADIQAKNGYQKMQISTKVKIKKATLNNFSFSDASDESILFEDGVSVTPTFTGALSGANIELSSGNPSVLEVQGNTLAIRGKGETEILATTPLASDAAYRNYIQKTATKKYKVYEGLGGDITQTEITMQVDEDTAYTDTQVGYFEYENGNGTVTSKITKGQEYFYKTDSNKLYLQKDILREDILWDDQGKNYYIPIQITLKDSTDNPVVLEKKITFIGASVPTLTFKDAVNGKITKPYKLNGRHPLDLNDYKDELGNVIYGPVTYRLKTDDTMPEGVVKDIATIDGVYNIFMGNANPKSVTIEAVIEPGNGYQGTIIPCEFEITKAQQDFDFKDMLINFKKGTTFTPQFSAKPKGNNGVVKLDSGNKNAVRVDGITLFGVDTGTSLITATATGNENFEDKIVTKEASVYDDLNLIFTPETVLPQAGIAKANTTIGTISLPGAQEPEISIDLSQVDNAYFKISGTALTLNKDINASDLASKTWNEDKKAYEMQVEITYSDKYNSAKTSMQTIYVKGAVTNVSFKDSEGNATTKIEKPYAKTPFTLELKNNAGDTWTYGDITYQLDESTNTTNVLERIDANGSVYIQNANLVGNPEKVKAIAKVAPANGYEETEIDCEIYITKATQPDFAFTSSINMELPGEVIPEYRGLLSSEPLTLTIVDKSVITYDKTTKKIVAQSVGKTQVSATTSADDRNYEVTTTPLVDVNVRNTTGYVLEIDVPESVTYGDSAELYATIKTDTSKGTEKTREWYSSKEDVASIDKDSGKITIHHAGSTLLHVSQTTNLEPAQDSLSLWFTVKPKSISVQISNKEKYVGQDVPVFTIEPVEGLLEIDKDGFIEPLYVCKDAKGNYVDAYTGTGEYSIEGQFVSSTNSTNKDYDITLLPGQLKVKQDTSLPSWYEVQSVAQPMDGWYNKPVTLKLVQGDGSYDKISDDMKGPWDESIVVSEEGIQSKDVYFKDTNTNKIASPQEEEIKVDETVPRITSIAGSEINTSPTARILNMLTLNQFFKPGSEIIITAEDVKPQEGIEVSEIAKIDYKIYHDVEDEEGNTLVKEGSVEADEAVVILEEPADYSVCAIAYDHAGNATKEECQKATIKKIDVDVDGDGPLDFNDSDQDGCPDLDIKWKDTDDKWVVINGDRDDDGVPDLNIDSDGDGIVDLNIDTDGDNLPDVNLVILKKSDWIPSKCVNTEVEEYCTGTTVKPLINVDTDVKNSKIEAELDIDTGGDMKADINISKNGKAAINIAIHKDWKPNVDYKVGKFLYDTDDELKRYLNIDTSGDGIPDVNVDLDDDGIADLNIDTDGDEIPNVDIDSDGDGERDINIDDDGDGTADREIMDIPEWKPDNKVDVNEDLSYGTITIKRNEYLKDEGFVMRNGDGNKFLPIYGLKVVDITNDKLITLQNYAFMDAEKREPIAVYELSLLRNEETVPLFTDALIQVPVDEDIKNPKFYLQDVEKVEFIPIEVKQESGFYTFTTSFLGELAILGEVQENEDAQIPKEDIDFSNHIGGVLGGSKTGDSTNLWMLISLLVGSSGVLLTIMKRKDLHN